MRTTSFVVAIAVLAYISRASLRSPGSHGFYRFFAWTCIVALCFTNFVGLNQWFADPLSPRQVVSWVLLVGSIYPALAGLHLLRHAGRPDERVRSEDHLYQGFENTTALVTSGIYRYVRHPMYASLLALTWGVFLKRPSLVGAALGLLATVMLVATARAEEGENVRYFGDAYTAYMRRTRRFVPFVV